MSNLTGNYKISAGEVQGLDIAREQERRARLQLLDEIREPSPQPIFGEPVKVELEDETSRRIKNTLGDFTQVLVNDPKNLLGISRSASVSGHGPPPNVRPQPPAKRATMNGVHKPSPTAAPSCMYQKLPPDKRPIYPRTNYNSASKPFQPISAPQVPQYQDIRNRDPSAWEKEQRRTNSMPVTFNMNVSLNGDANVSNSNVFNPVPFSTTSAVSGLNKPSPSLGQNGIVSNSMPQMPRLGKSSNNAPQQKRFLLRPISIKLPERKPEKPAESQIDVETILSEMKQAVPPPLTAIQTPKTDETGFAFPADSKQEMLFEKMDADSEPHVDVPQPPEEPKMKESSPLQSTPSPYAASSLQKDLEMSESDEEVVPETKSSPNVYLKSPENNTLAAINNPTVTTDNSTNMDVTPAATATAAADSSSSDSGDSDSDDSSSESNDSDSSASSDASDVDTPSKPAPQMWGLSNFFDETRRNHSPAFLPVDTSTNSSIPVKEEPVLVPAVERESYCLVDEESVNNILQGYSGGDLTYLSGPVPDPITDFLELDTPVNIKNEIISPIQSPLPLSVPVVAPVRGPRTPPTPSYAVKEDSVEVNNGDVQSQNNEIAAISSGDLSQSAMQSSMQQADVLQNICDTKEDKNKVQIEKRKQFCLGKSKLEIDSPIIQSSPTVHSVDVEEPSASKGLPDASSDKEKDATPGNVMTSSCSVPSETSDSSHENYSIKTRQKLSASSSLVKKAKSVNADSSGESGQKSNISVVKSPVISKFKHPTRACRISNEAKPPASAVSTAAKLDQTEEPKRRAKSEVKEKENLCNKEKSSLNAKPILKSVKSKNKSSKASPKQVTDVKKTEVKRKKKKFAIENFLQSQNESEKPPVVLPQLSPSPERSPIPEYKKEAAGKVAAPTASPLPSRSPSISSSKGAEKVKVAKNLVESGEKLRRSLRCSERAISNAQTENTSTRQIGEGVKKSVKVITKARARNTTNLPIHTVPPLVSPIPQDSPIPALLPECAIPSKIMVCIPLEKLSRLPTVLQAQESISKPISKNRSSSLRSVDDEVRLQKKDISQDKVTNNVLNKRAQSKDFKDKPRTVPFVKNIRNNSKNVSMDKIEKNSKPSSEPLLSGKSSFQNKTASNVHNKNSIKAAMDKTLCDNSEIKISKKRKCDEGDKQLLKKKPKVVKKLAEERKLKEQSAALRTETTNQNEGPNKSKTLERCDSASSLSSLCSQQSQRSSKSSKEKIKDSSSNASDSKRMKASKSPLLSKDIKQEKDDRTKLHIKKEPGILTSTNKNKTKSRDKLASKDIDCKEKVYEQLWNDSLNASSQFCHWEEPCKENPQGQLLTNQSLANALNSDSNSNWDHFSPEMHKDLKETSNLNKHNQTPIMPMDYYWTEAKKQKQLADKEKDPLLRALKFFEATVLFILTSQQKEEDTKDPDSVYQFYKETLDFSREIRNSVQKSQSCPGSTEFKLLILCLKCQSLLHVKLYNLKVKEIKVQQKGVSDFFSHQCTTAWSSYNPTHSFTYQPRIASLASVPSPHSPTPPASSVNSQTSGYSSSDISGRGSLQSLPVSVPQNILDMICRQHTHLLNLHQGHDLWEQADMYMTRSNLREFFKDVADQSEPLTLHSTIKELVNYVQKGISLVKKCPR